MNEKDYSVTFYEFDGGTLTPKQILPTLPETYTGDGWATTIDCRARRWAVTIDCHARRWASGIIMSRDDRHVIVSNRKHDSITSFNVDDKTGMLKFSRLNRTIETESPVCVIFS